MLTRTVLSLYISPRWQPAVRSQQIAAQRYIDPATHPAERSVESRGFLLLDKEENHR